MKILIKNIEEIYSPNLNNSQNKSLIIEDRIIKKIDKLGNLDLTDNYDQIIDAQGKIMLPGFINSHTHAAMTLMRGYADDMPLDSWLKNKIWPFESKIDSDDIYWGSLLAILEMIKTGTTSFADMYFAMEKTAAAVEESGIRAVLAAGLIEANDGQKGLNEALDFALEFNQQAEGRITTMLAPHAPYTCSRDYLIKIKELALKNNLAVHIHLSESKKELADFKKEHQQSPIKFLDDFDFFDNHILAAHCVHLEAGDLKIMADNKVNVAHNPASNAKLANGIAPIKKYLANKINVSLATDGVSSNNSLDLLNEARMASYLQKIKTGDPTVLNTDQLLKMMTHNGAQTLNLANLGLIKEGYKADLLLIDINQDSFYIPHHNNLSNLFYAADSRSVDTVIINGKVVMENKELKTLDQERIYYEVEKRSQKIAASLS